MEYLEDEFQELEEYSEEWDLMAAEEQTAVLSEYAKSWDFDAYLLGNPNA